MPQLCSLYGHKTIRYKYYGCTITIHKWIWRMGKEYSNQFTKIRQYHVSIYIDIYWWHKGLLFNSTLSSTPDKQLRVENKHKISYFKLIYLTDMWLLWLKYQLLMVHTRHTFNNDEHVICCSNNDFFFKWALIIPTVWILCCIIYKTTYF